MPDREIEIDEIWREPDKDLKLNSVQKHLITFAKKHNGKFTIRDYEHHLKDTVDDMKQQEYLLIRKNNACLRLVNAGYLIEKKGGGNIKLIHWSLNRLMNKCVKPLSK